MSQIMGLPADKLLEDYTPGEKMAYTYNSKYQAAIADVMNELSNARNVLVERDTIIAPQAQWLLWSFKIRIKELLEDKS